MSAWHRSFLAALVLAAGVFAVCAASASEAPQEKQPHRDRFDDPLPNGAIYRVGSARFRVGQPVLFLAFSKDGKTLLSVNRDSLLDVVRYWDAASGKQLREFSLIGGTYGSAALSPDGKLLAALRYVKGGEIIQLVDTTTGQEVCSFAGQYGKGIAFAPDGRTLATADEKGTILLCNPASGKSLGQWKGDQSRCHAIAFSPDGKQAASIDDKSIVRLWDRAAGRELRRCQVKKDSYHVARLAFSPDGEMIVATYGGVMMFWNTKTGRELRTVPLRGEKWCSELAFSPDGEIVAVEDGDVVCLVNVSSGKEIRKLGRRKALDLDSDGGCLAFSPDGSLLASGGKSIRLWHVADGKEVRPRGDEALEIDSAVFTSDGRFLATGGPDEFIRLWDAASGAEVRRFKARAPDIGSLAFSRDGKMLVLRQDEKFFLWDWAAGKELRRVEAPPNTRRLALSPSGEMLAWSGKDRTIHLCDLATGKELHSWRSKVYPINSLRFSPQGKLLIAVDPCWGEQPQSEIRDVMTGEECSAARRGGILAVSADDRIAARLDDHHLTVIHFREVASSKDLGGTDPKAGWAFRGGAPRQVHAAVFSPDGRTLATAVEYEPIRLWETATGKERHRLPKQRGQIVQLAFATDGDKLVSVSTEKNAVVWRVLGAFPGQQPVEMSAEKLRGLWADLASEDGQVAFRAIRALTAAAPGPVVDFLRRQGIDIPRFDRQRVARWIAELDADDFAVREKATAELEKLGVRAEGPLRKALQDRPNLEMRKRLEILLNKLKDRPITPATVRGWRAVEVLEHLATPEARRLLEEWATGEPEARLTREAKASLERLARRPRAEP